MNTKFILGLTALVGAAIYFLKGKKEAIENLIIKPTMLAINRQKTNIYQAVFTLRFQVTNPSAASVKILGINLDVFINGKKATNIKQLNVAEIMPNKTENIEIEFAIFSWQAVDIILNLLADGGTINVNVKGPIVTDLGTVNVNYNKAINV
jgi:LEA14-like dessication related protein